MTEDIRKLIAYRLDQAAETLDVAKELRTAGHYRDTVNRAYYAMFYCGLGPAGLQRVWEPVSTAAC